MKSQPLTVLCGIKLTSSFDSVRAKLGQPDFSDHSPFDEGDRFGTYSWTTREISVLTWLTDQGEYVWGIRIDGPRASDPELGFSVGSQRSDVLKHFVGLWKEHEDILEIDFESSRLVVTFTDDRICSIRLLGPMGTAE